MNERSAAMNELKELLAAEGAAAEAAEADPDSPKRSDVRVTRGHPRSKTLQVRLNDDEVAALVVIAEDRGLPVSTVARHMLLQSLAPADDIKSAFDRLERDLSALRRRVLSG
jgi:hypothetical protein